MIRGEAWRHGDMPGLRYCKIHERPAGSCMRTLMIVYHSLTGGTLQMARAAAEAAGAEPDLEVSMLRAADAQPSEVLGADGYLFATPENLAAMCGQMKDFFDRTYYAALDRLNGRPYGVLVCAGSDGRQAADQIARIATGWRLRAVAEPVIVCTHAQTPRALLWSRKSPRPISRDARNSGRPWPRAWPWGSSNRLRECCEQCSRRRAAARALQLAPRESCPPGLRRRIRELDEPRDLVGGHVLPAPPVSASAMRPRQSSLSTIIAFTVSPRRACAAIAQASPAPDGDTQAIPLPPARP